MNIKNLFNSMFAYTPPVNYNFSLPENTQTSEANDNEIQKTEEKVKVFPNLEANIEYMKTRYNLLINSDIILRQFTINARGKQYSAFLVYKIGRAHV